MGSQVSAGCSGPNSDTAVPEAAAGNDSTPDEADQSSTNIGPPISSEKSLSAIAESPPPIAATPLNIISEAAKDLSASAPEDAVIQITESIVPLAKVPDDGAVPVSSPSNETTEADVDEDEDNKENPNEDKSDETAEEIVLTAYEPAVEAPEGEDKSETRETESSPAPIITSNSDAELSPEDIEPQAPPTGDEPAPAESSLETEPGAENPEENESNPHPPDETAESAPVEAADDSSDSEQKPPEESDEAQDPQPKAEFHLPPLV